MGIAQAFLGANDEAQSPSLFLGLPKVLGRLKELRSTFKVEFKPPLPTIFGGYVARFEAGMLQTL